MDENLRVNEASSPRHYEKVGYFVVRFEQVINAMRTCILNLLEKYGFESEQFGLAVTADLNARDVLSLLRSAIGIHLQDNPDPHLSKVSRQLFKETQELLERRNTLLHSFWSDRESPHHTSHLGYRFTNTKEGVSYRRLPTLKGLEQDIKKATLVFRMLCALNAIVREAVAPDLAQAFKFNENKKLYFDIQFAKSIGFRSPIDQGLRI